MDAYNPYLTWQINKKVLMEPFGMQTVTMAWFWKLSIESLNITSASLFNMAIQGGSESNFDGVVDSYRPIKEPGF
jgi:hypothetical protein